MKLCTTRVLVLGSILCLIFIWGGIDNIDIGNTAIGLFGVLLAFILVAILFLSYKGIGQGEL
jgi:hypothetical protein